jgi:hypothetical protein
MADGGLKIGRKVRSKLFCHQIFFYLPKPKIHDFNLEKHPPKSPFFLKGGVAKNVPLILRYGLCTFLKAVCVVKIFKETFFCFGQY